METLISILITLGASVVFAIVGTVLGCLLSGIDRIISARMQGRVGPPLLQPLYDVRKLFAKDNVAVNGTIGTYVVCALIFTFLAGGIFFSGGNFLLCGNHLTADGAVFAFRLARLRAGRPDCRINHFRVTSLCKLSLFRCCASITGARFLARCCAACGSCYCPFAPAVA